MDERHVDFFDLFMEIVRRWKLILLCAFLAGALAGCFYLFMSEKGGNIASEMSQTAVADQETAYQDILNAKRMALTTAEAEEVERLHGQLQSYIKYRQQYQASFDSFLGFSQNLEEDYLVRRGSYVLSSKVEGAENLLSSMSMDIDDYRKIMDISQEAATLDAAYNYVSIWTASKTGTQIENKGENGADIPTEFLIYYEVLGKNKEICDEEANVVEAALGRELGELQRIDPEIQLLKTGVQYRGNAFQYITSKKQSIFDYIQKIDTTIYSLRNNYIDKLSAAQKNYYNVLKDPEYKEEQEEEAGQSRFSLTILVAGVLVGTILGVLYAAFHYLLDGTIKIKEEIEEDFHLSVFEMIPETDRGEGRLSRSKQKHCSRGAFSEESRIRLIAADVCDMMQKANTDGLYIVQTTEEARDRELSSRICEAVSEKKNEFRVEAGIPLCDEEALLLLMQSENVLLLIHEKRTLRKDVEKLLDICSRHSVPVCGTVLIAR